MIRTVLYTRVSSDKEEQVKSLYIQKEVYKDYCDKNGYELIGEPYADVGTGTNVRERPRFVEMMSNAGLDYEVNNDGTDIFRTSDRTPKFDMIIVKDASRFSRNAEIGDSTVKRLRDMGVTVLFENAAIKSTDHNANLIIPLLFIMAENESQNASDRIKFSKRYLAVNQIYKPARLPYGYVWNEDREIVIQEEQAEIVRFIYNRFLLEGSHILSKKLNDMGVLTQKGKNWAGYRIIRIIKNMIYTGTAVMNKSSKKNVTDTKRYKIPNNQHIHIQNATPPIVSFEQWEKANKLLEQRTNLNGHSGKKPSTKDIYYGKLFCQNCGSRFIRHTGKNDKITYMCIERRASGMCAVRGISINNLNKIFDEVSSVFIDDMSNYKGYNTLINRITSESKLLEKRRDEIDFEVLKIEEENIKMLKAIKNELGGGSKVVIEMLSDDIENNKAKVKIFQNNKEKLEITNLNTLKNDVESKKQLIEEIRTKKKMTNKEKMQLLHSITIGDYECVAKFSYPNFEEETLRFNEIYSMEEIESTTAHNYEEVFRRTHKDAREYWEEYDINQQDS